MENEFAAVDNWFLTSKDQFNSRAVRGAEMERSAEVTAEFKRFQSIKLDF